jgi:hypothetical protein
MATIFYSADGHELYEHETYIAHVFEDGTSGSWWGFGGPRADADMGWAEGELPDHGPVVGWRAQCDGGFSDGGRHVPCPWRSHQVTRQDGMSVVIEDETYLNGYLDGLARAHVQPFLDELDESLAAVS